MTLESSGPNARHAGLTERACRSPTCLIDANANKKAVFSERGLRSTDWSGSKGGPLKALRTVERSHGDTEGGLEWLILLAPFQKSHDQVVYSHWLASHQNMVCCNRCHIHIECGRGATVSNSSCWNERTTDISHDSGSIWVFEQRIKAPCWRGPSFRYSGKHLHRKVPGYPFKGIVHPKMKIKSLITRPHAIPTM